MDLYVKIGIMCVILVVVMAYVSYVYRLDRIRKIILSLVIQAERKFGPGNGVIKYSYVVGLVYPSIPLAARVFISEKLVGEIIEDGVLYIKEHLAEPPCPPIVTCNVPPVTVAPDAQTTITSGYIKIGDS
jgi:hypothetical protein